MKVTREHAKVAVVNQLQALSQEIRDIEESVMDMVEENPALHSSVNYEKLQRLDYFRQSFGDCMRVLVTLNECSSIVFDIEDFSVLLSESAAWLTNETEIGSSHQGENKNGDLVLL